MKMRLINDKMLRSPRRDKGGRIVNNANHRAQISDLLDEWTDNPKQAKNIINCLVEFLTSDMYWLNQYISKIDRETLILAAKKLEGKGD